MKHLWLLNLLIPGMLISGSLKVIQKDVTDDPGFAVIELFTSEGCSSCPAAEKVLKEISQEYQGRAVYVLAFHVDYWNKLGWKDKFSSPKFTERQYKYSETLKEQVYTPQAIVNGKQVLIGSENEKMHQAIEEALKKKAKVRDTKYHVEIKEGKLQLDYTLDPSLKGNLMSVALIQNQESNEIKAGENKGKLLEHVNVVRAFSSERATEPSGSLSLNIPEGLEPKGLHVLVYLQNRITLRVISVSKLTL
ncbi:DUF1223 domain-containing protein [Pedobacter caeni]|uniref:DUF1223 domain-containing protein n=1 Tax=Pedobacter caeni TaxID=288992 RepID=A0A1M5EVD8_9SPHI|nr:DUF1223 domain-containing protein [Pedobacter caeni]SHF83205.1 Protein of unknown function [Pedobacter caeni]